MQNVIRLMLTVFLFSSFAAAQSSRVGGTIEGTVSDPSRSRIAGATVEVQEVSTGRVRALRTDAQGLFRAAALPIGIYEVRAGHSGFAPYVHPSLQLELGADIHLDIMLDPASAATTVTVTGQPSALEPSQTSMTSVVDRERIEELPVESRNALDFVLIEPGVSTSPQGRGGSPHAALEESGFTFGGLRARSNSISIDGLDNNDEFTGASRTELSPEIVQEYQVVHNGLSAEFGGASGGSINVVTRTGSNTIHGDAFIFQQNSALNSRDPFESESAKPNFNRFRTGFSIGGPIKIGARRPPAPPREQEAQPACCPLCRSRFPRVICHRLDSMGLSCPKRDPARSIGPEKTRNLSETMSTFSLSTFPRSAAIVRVEGNSRRTPYRKQRMRKEQPNSADRLPRVLNDRELLAI